MKVNQPTNESACFTSIMNIYHLFYTWNIKEVLIDKKCRNYVDAAFTIISRLRVDFNITEPIKPDYLDANQITDESLADYLLESPLKPKYDLLVVDAENTITFLPFMHRCVFIFICGNPTGNLIPYTRINDCFEGHMYVNDFHSIIFPTVKLTEYEQTYIRDKPYRYLRKMQHLLRHFSCKTIVEIGSSRTRMNHVLSDINPMCCNDSHSTFFWAEMPATVYTVDINPMCETILEDAHEKKTLKIKGKLHIVNEDGITFLKEYDGDSIDFIFLDAWDVIPGRDYAERHLEAYEVVKDKLSEKIAFIGIDDTDVGAGGKGKLLIPQLIKDGWTPLYQGRHTVFFRGDKNELMV